MIKQLKLAAAIGALAMIGAAAPATAASTSPFPSSVSEAGSFFFNMEMHQRMDRNRDGMVSRDEFLDYFGRAFDRMDTSRRGMLTAQEFTHKERMKKAFTND